LLFNVLKHAQTNRARVCLLGEGDHLRVIVEDNGVGFTPDKLCAASGKIEGFGLFSIRERLNYFGGHMEIESIPGEVTRVILTVPIEMDMLKRNTRLAAPAPTRVPLPAASRKVVSRPSSNSPPPSRAALT
jgi:signal transduction histidine kinase